MRRHGSRLNAFDAPPGDLVMLAGRGLTYHYGDGVPFSGAICGVEMTEMRVVDPPDPGNAPDAKLCAKCRAEALRLHDDHETTARDAGANDRHPKT